MQRDSDLLIATAFLHASGVAPNAPTRGDQEKFRMYYRCMVAMFASARSTYPDARLVCFSDRAPDGPEGDALRRLGVEHLACTPRLTASIAASSAFPGCLYTLDAIRWFADHSDSRMLVLLDSDVIVRKRFDAFLEQCMARPAVGFLEMQYSPTETAIGQSRATIGMMSSLYRGGLLRALPPYVGGELLVVPAAASNLLAKEIDDFATWFNRDGRLIFGGALTEEHVLSAVGPWVSAMLCANEIAKRVWTTRSVSNVDGSESRYSVWHLPALKRSALSRLGRDLTAMVMDKGDVPDGELSRLIERHVVLERWAPESPLQQLLGPLARLRKRLR